MTTEWRCMSCNCVKEMCVCKRQVNLTMYEITLLLYGLHTRIAMAERVDGAITSEHQAYLDLQKKLRELKK